MSDGVDIPITTPGGVEGAAVLRALAQAMKDLGVQTQEAGAKASATKSAFSFNEITQAVTTVHGAMTRLASSVSALATEQAQLDAGSARLGLNFDVAAEKAGRFTDETEAMTAASRLAEAGIRLTQDQLNDLTRVAARFAQNTGTTTAAALDQLTNGLITGSARGLRPFGAELQAVAGGSHTAEQRLAALAEQASHTATATDDAASSMARFNDSIEDAARTLATSFVEGLTEITRVGAAADESGNKFEILTEDITTAGHTIGMVFGGVANGIGVVAGVVATSIAALLSGIIAAGAGAGAVIDRLRSGHVTGLYEAATRAARASVDDSPITRSLIGFTEDRAAAANRIADETIAYAGTDRGPRASRARGGGTGGAPGVDMEGGGSRDRDNTPSYAEATRAKIVESDRYNREQAALRVAAARDYLRILGEQQAAELAARRTASDAYAEEATHANELARIRARIIGLSNEETAANEVRALRARAAGQRAEGVIGQRAELEDARDPAVQRERIDEMRRSHTLERERAHLAQRYEMQRSYVDRMEELHSTEADGTRALAEGVSGAFAGMGQAIAKHAQGLLDGKESVGEALQGMLSDTLASLAQQAVVKGAMETAEGIAALAGIVTAPLAPGHFAAAGAYFGVAALAGLGAAATAPSSGSAAASAPAAAREPAARVSGSKGSASEGGAVVYNVNFGGPMYGTGGVRQAARQMVGAINRGAIQGGVQLLPGTLLGGGAGA